MRRLAPILVVASLLGALAAPGAGARPRLVVAGGSAKAAGGRLRGWFVVRNTGAEPSGRAKASVLARSGKLSRRVQETGVPALAPYGRRRVKIAAAIPQLPAGGWSFDACVLGRCRGIGKVDGGKTAGPGGGSEPPEAPTSTVPTVPLHYVVDEPFFYAGGGVEYWAFVPNSYDRTNQTPTKLLIWLHGCGGESEGDIWVVDPGAEPGVAQDWLTLALGGREGQCWVPSADEPKVLAALADFETHFNVDRRRVILGGYSSGGDLAYRTGFRNSSTFAGLLIENSAPWSETELSKAESLAAPTKFHVVHLAHTEDTTYPIGTVREQVSAMAAAGFPVQLIERPGAHYDERTDSDVIEYLLPHMDDGWLSP